MVRRKPDFVLPLTKWAKFLAVLSSIVKGIHDITQRIIKSLG